MQQKMEMEEEDGKGITRTKRRKKTIEINNVSPEKNSSSSSSRRNTHSSWIRFVLHSWIISSSRAWTSFFDSTLISDADSRFAFIFHNSLNLLSSLANRQCARLNSLNQPLMCVPPWVVASTCWKEWGLDLGEPGSGCSLEAWVFRSSNPLMIRNLIQHFSN